MKEANIVLVEGFSSLRGKKRLQVLDKAIKKEFPEVKIVIPEYFERYGRIGKFFRKRTIPEYAETVRQMLPVNFPADADKPILIGYSMGGLICRYLVEEIQFPVKAMILVGTPNKGIKLSRWEKLFLKITHVPCIEEMKKDSIFLQQLNKDLNLDPRSYTYHLSLFSRNYYYLGGKLDKKVSLESSLPWEILQDRKRYAGSDIFWTSHSGLIPKKTIKQRDFSAIPAILEILRKEIKTRASLNNCSFLF